MNYLLDIKCFLVHLSAKNGILKTMLRNTKIYIPINRLKQGMCSKHDNKVFHSV